MTAGADPTRRAPKPGGRSGCTASEEDLIVPTDEFTTWLRRLHPGPDTPRPLICFPAGGGSASSYRALAEHLAPATTVYAVQYPGRQDRIGDPAVPSIPDLADHITEAMAPLLTAGPVALFGHSMGATVAFETARRVERRGGTVTTLFVSGRPDPSFDEHATLHRGPDNDLIADLERLANDPASVRILRTEPELAAMVLPAVRNDYQAVETYRYRGTGTLTCDIVALLGREDPTTTPAQLQAWREHTSGSFDARLFPGRHFYLDERPREVAEAVREKIAAAGGQR